MTSSSPIINNLSHEKSSLSIGIIPYVTSDCPTVNQLVKFVKHLFMRFFPVFLMECKLSESFFLLNADASNVEDTKIPQIVERLSMFCTASFFRIPSFTLCKNVRDLGEKFDSTAVSEPTSSWMTNLSSAGLPFLLPTFLQISTLEKTSCCSILRSLMNKCPSQVSPFLVAAHSTSSEVFDVHIWFSPGFLMQQKLTREDPLHCIARPNSSSVAISL